MISAVTYFLTREAKTIWNVALHLGNFGCSAEKRKGANCEFLMAADAEPAAGYFIPKNYERGKSRSAKGGWHAGGHNWASSSRR
jgi:hypothetical protein